MLQREALRPVRRLGVVLVVALLAGLAPAAASAQGNGLERALAVHERAAERLMATQGVVGTGLAVGAGAATIRVYTATAQARVPREIEGVAVQAVVTGLITARACQDTGDPSDRCNRPVPIGVSVGHPDVTAGTIGARVKNAGGAVFALSNNHVLANSNNASIGDPALQPGTVDGGSDPADRIGTLAAFKTISFNRTGCTGGASDPDCNTIDAAIAATTTGNLGVSTLPAGYGTPSATIVNPSVGQSVQKCGRTTGCTTGTVAEINATVDVCYVPQGPFCARNGAARFVNQIGISSGSFSAGGDSGSLIVTSSGRNPVGLLFAGGSNRTFANEIGRVLTHFSVSIDTNGTTPPPDTTAPEAPTSLSATGGDAQVSLDWANNAESDLAGYNVYRSTTSGGPYTKDNATLVTTSAYSDTGLVNGTTYVFVVTAVDTSGNESNRSNEASATPQAPPAAGAPVNLTAVLAQQGTVKVDLAWSGGAGTVAVQRQAPGSSSFATVATVSNSGSYRDNLGRRPASGTWTYQVCNAGTTSCSNTASVTVP